MTLFDEDVREAVRETAFQLGVIVLNEKRLVLDIASLWSQVYPTDYRSAIGTVERWTTAHDWRAKEFAEWVAKRLAVRLVPYAPLTEEQIRAKKEARERRIAYWRGEIDEKPPRL